MKKSIFQYAVLLHIKNEKGEVVDTKLIIEPTTMLAKSDREVAFKVTRLIPEDIASGYEPENIEILVKSF